MQNIIETINLQKKYGNKAAVDNVSIHVAKGDIYGLIGKNGAGKTTLMRLLLGLTSEDSGEITLFGSKELSKERAKIGSIIEEPGLYYNKTAYDNMKTFSLLHGNVSDEEIKDILKRVGLSDTGRKKVSGFSLGMRQRLGIAIALMGKPELLILDEPINGLDPAGIKEIRDMILELNQTGVSFMISSHLLDELAKVVTRYGIMADGELVEEISAKELKERCNKHLEVTVDDVNKAHSVLAQSFPQMVLKNGNDDNTLCIMSEVEDSSEISCILVNNGIRLYALKQQGTAFEDYFIERFGEAK